MSYQDDKQHNAALRRQNRNKIKQLKDSIYVKNHLFRLKTRRRKKYAEG
jgi:hypothetical protein